VTAGSDAVQQTERLTVTGVDLAVRAPGRWRWASAMVALLALPLVALGLVLDPEDLGDFDDVDQEGADAIGTGGATDILEWVLALAANIDAVMLYTGVGLLGLALLLGAVYWFVIREATVAIRLAGDQADIHVPRGNAGPATVTALERVILGEDDGKTAAMDRPDARAIEGDESGEHPGLPPDGTPRPLPTDAIMALPATTVDATASESGDADATGENP